MPIEFRCTECGKLLRVADGSVGRHAKCPACGAIITVAEPPATEPGSADAGQAPFAPADSVNPYQAPADSSTMNRPQSSSAAPGVRPAKIQFSDVFSHSWNIFTEQWLMCVVVFLVFFVVMACIFGAVAGVIILSVAVTQSIAIVAPVAVLAVVAGMIVMVWISVGIQLFFIKMARGHEVEFGDLFAGGPYLLRYIGASALYSLGLCAIMGIFLAPCTLLGLAIDNELALVGLVAGGILAVVPTMIYWLTFFPFSYLIIDQNMGIMDSFAVSREVTLGNRWMMLAIIVVMALIGSAINQVTCNLGTFVVSPFTFLLYAVMYMRMIGQPTADMRQQVEAPRGA